MRPIVDEELLPADAMNIASKFDEISMSGIDNIYPENQTYYHDYGNDESRHFNRYLSDYAKKQNDTLTMTTTVSKSIDSIIRSPHFFITTMRNFPVESSIHEEIDNEFDRQSRRMRLVYLYGTPPLIFFCAISVAINIKILMSVRWIRRPLSPTLQISLSLAGADTFSSTALAIGLVMNSLIPRGLQLELSGANCFLLSLEAIRLGGIMITVGHLVALAVNHYLGILKPLHYLTIMTHRITTFIIFLLWTWPLVFFFAYFGAVDNEGFRSKNCEINTFLLKKKFRMMFSSFFFGPLILMVCIYAHIFHIVRKHQASRLRFTRAATSFRRCGDVDREEHSASQQMARNVKAINTTLLILGSFVVGWMPATFLYILVCEDCVLKFNWITDYAKFFVYNAACCLIILKTLVNPIIYAARMHEIKVATKRMHNSLCCFGNGKSYSKERNRGTRSSEGLTNRISGSKNGTCRLVIEVDQSCDIKNNRRDDCYKYTYKGVKGYSRDNTLV